MESVTSRIALPEQPPSGVTGGLDLACDIHAVPAVDDRGGETYQHTLERSAAGLAKMIDALGRAGVVEVAIQCPGGPVADALLAVEMTVVVITPNQIKNLRGRYCPAGSTNDRFDAFVLTDTLRTDRARLRPLTDSPAKITLRRTCWVCDDLVAHRCGLAN